MTINKSIGKKIKQARNQLQYSQKTLGEKVGYSIATISQIENGNFRISVESLGKIAKALKKPINYFLAEEDRGKYTFGGQLIKIENELEKIRDSLNKETINIRKNYFNIVVTGSIGTAVHGRHELIHKLGKIFNAKTFPEKPEENPYLEKFYKNKKKWAFHSQIAFIRENFERQAEIRKKLGPVIQGRGLYENFRIFMTTWHEMGYLSKDEFRLLEDFYHYAKILIRKPDLVIYLRSDPDKLVNQVLKERGGSMRKKHLLKIHNKYEEWIKNFDIAPVMIVDLEKTDLFDEKTVLRLAKRIKETL